MPDVKRLQIMIDEDLDAALDRMALQERTSKAALIRRFVQQNVKPLPPLEEDPLWKMIGSDHYEPADIDEVVYGLGSEPER
jgi:DNA replication protein DnaD